MFFESCQKEAHFYVAMPLANQIVAYLDSILATTKYELEANIVNVIIGDMVWNRNDIEGVSYANAMRIFTWITDNGVYAVTVSSSLLFCLSVKYIAFGMSFKHTALAVQAANEETSCEKDGGENSKFPPCASAVRSQLPDA